MSISKEETQRVRDEVHRLADAPFSKSAIENCIWRIGVPRDDIAYGPKPHDGVIHSGRYGIWQIPTQLADLCYLIHQDMKQSRPKIKRYIEVGTWTGYTFTFLTEFIRLYRPNLPCLSCDIKDQRVVFPEYAEFIDGDSSNIDPRPGDFVFIDGDHSYDACKLDYERLVTPETRMIAFHDIASPSESCRGVVKHWQERVEYADRSDIFALSLTSTDGPGRNLGIGVIMQ